MYETTKEIERSINAGRSTYRTKKDAIKSSAGKYYNISNHQPIQIKRRFETVWILILNSEKLFLGIND
jgi:hypothetical protein